MSAQPILTALTKSQDQPHCTVTRHDMEQVNQEERPFQLPGSQPKGEKKHHIMSNPQMQTIKPQLVTYVEIHVEDIRKIDDF